MWFAQGHNAVPPVRLEPVALDLEPSTLDTTMLMPSLPNSSGDLYPSVHRALDLLSL